MSAISDLGVQHALQPLSLRRQLAQQHVAELGDVFFPLHAHGGTQTSSLVGGCAEKMSCASCTQTDTRHMGLTTLVQLFNRIFVQLLVVVGGAYQRWNDGGSFDLFGDW